MKRQNHQNRYHLDDLRVIDTEFPRKKEPKKATKAQISSQKISRKKSINFIQTVRIQPKKVVKK